MNNSCAWCKHGQPTKPNGQKVSPGTVWCGQRSMQMGKNRPMPCFQAIGVHKVHHCIDCKWARMVKHSGETPQLGHIWCEKRHAEMNKQRSMECFE